MGDPEDGSDGRTASSTANLDAATAGRGSQAAVADLYRRRAVQCLGRAAGPVPVAELARVVVARTGQKPPDTVSLDEQKRMYTALVRTHLPALESAGLVEWDPAGDAVALAEEAEDLLPDDD